MTWLSLSGIVWEKPLPALEEFPEASKPGAGVYRLIASDIKGHPISISRVCGEDRSGTLYIGMAESLEVRVNELRKTLRPEMWKGGRHGAGLLLRRTDKMRSRFPNEHLSTTWALADDPWDVEAELIKSYVREFGEGPPLNRQRSTPDHDQD
jgi:hypothetical protein